MNEELTQNTNSVPAAPPAPPAPSKPEPLANDEQQNEFQRVKERLEEIAQVVDSEEISLDDALDLYEEAVALGLQATDLLDVDITAQEEAQARILGEDGDDAEFSDEPDTVSQDQEIVPDDNQLQGAEPGSTVQDNLQAD